MARCGYSSCYYGVGWSLTARDFYGTTPLHCAAANGQLETIKWLVQRNSDLLCMQDKYGGTPLHWAALNGHLEVVKWQVERRGYLLFMQDKGRRTPLDIAVLCGRHEVERWLVKKGGGAVTAGPVSVQHVVSNYLCQSVRVCCVVLYCVGRATSTSTLSPQHWSTIAVTPD